MKRSLLVILFAMLTLGAFAISGQVLKSVDVTSARLSAQLTELERTTVTGLTITAGEVTADDVTFMLNMPALVSLNMKAATTTGNVVGGFSNAILKTVILPDATVTIADQAFSSCTALTSITIPEGVTTLGFRVFEHCSALQSITLPNSITTMGVAVFAWSTSLTTVNIPTGLTTLNSIFFQYCTALTSITIPENIKGIGDVTFYGSGLTSVTIPASVKTLGFNSFGNCAALTSVAFAPNSQLTAIADNSFYGCAALTTFTIPSKVTTIGQQAFSGCTSLTTMTNEATVPQTITADVFSGVTTANIKLNVPKSAVDTYNAAPVWGTFNVQGTDPTGIAKNEASSVKLTVAHGMMQVSDADTMASVDVYSTTGAKIDSRKNTSNATFSNLPHGTVIVKVTSSNGSSSTMKAVIE